jgi:hypothetical protein
VAKDQVATTKSAKTPGTVAPKPKGVFQNLLALQQTLTDAVATLKLHLQQFGCKYLNAGCFAAGTPLWTPGGYRAIETLVPGSWCRVRDTLWLISATVWGEAVDSVSLDRRRKTQPGRFAKWSRLSLISRTVLLLISTRFSEIGSHSMKNSYLPPSSCMTRFDNELGI